MRVVQWVLWLAAGIGCSAKAFSTPAYDLKSESVRRNEQGIYELTIDGIAYEMVVSQGIFALQELVAKLAQSLRHVIASLEQPVTVCDIGTGAGILALHAAAYGARRVFATDINPDAVRDAQNNFRWAGFSNRLTALTGSAYEPLTAGEQRCDLIVPNPPQAPTTSSCLNPNRVGGGSDGTAFICQLIQGAHKVLAPQGELCFIHYSFANLSRVLNECATPHFATAEVVAEVPWSVDDPVDYFD